MFGADPIRSGEYFIDGKLQPRISVVDAVAQGIALVPEDRRKQGLVLTQTVRPNISLGTLGAISRGGIINRTLEVKRVKEMIAHFGIVPGQVDGRVLRYSGGNQQKVLLSKWAVALPKLLILDEPSRGVDIGARQRIHQFIVETARQGVGILLISSELEEVINLSHRSYLLSDGRIFAEEPSSSLTVESALHRVFLEQNRDSGAATGWEGASGVREPRLGRSGFARLHCRYPARACPQGPASPRRRWSCAHGVTQRSVSCRHARHGRRAVP